MPLGIIEATNTTMNNVTDLFNGTNPVSFFLNVNNSVYGGYLFFILLLLGMFILFVTMNSAQVSEGGDQYLLNLMYSSAAVTFVSLLLRGVQLYEHGLWKGLLTDSQMWVFPIITLVLALIVYMGKKQ